MSNISSASVRNQTGQEPQAAPAEPGMEKLVLPCIGQGPDSRNLTQQQIQALTPAQIRGHIHTLSGNPQELTQFISQLEPPQLVNLLGSNSYDARRLATNALAARGEPMRNVLIEAQRSPDQEIRSRAGSLLATLNERAFGDMVTDLASPDAVRRAAGDRALDAALGDAAGSRGARAQFLFRNATTYLTPEGNRLGAEIVTDLIVQYVRAGSLGDRGRQAQIQTELNHIPDATVHPIREALRARPILEALTPCPVQHGLLDQVRGHTPPGRTN